MIFAFGCTKNWYEYLVVDIYSLLKFNPTTKKIYLFLETDTIDEVPYLKEVQERFNVELVLINFNQEKNRYVTKDNPNVDTPYTDFAFCKLVLADYIKEDKVIYLDTDTIVRKDIKRLWYWDIDEYYVAGCKDKGVILSPYYKELNITGKYINTGVMLLNLKKIREDKIIPKVFEILNDNELKYPDQDAFNLVVQNKITYIPSIYNQAFCITNQVALWETVKIWHLARDKEEWVVNINFSENWYEAEEEFFFDIKNQ